MYMSSEDLREAREDTRTTQEENLRLIDRVEELEDKLLGYEIELQKQLRLKDLLVAKLKQQDTEVATGATGDTVPPLCSFGPGGDFVDDVYPRPANWRWCEFKPLVVLMSLIGCSGLAILCSFFMG